MSNRTSTSNKTTSMNTASPSTSNAVPGVAKPESELSGVYGAGKLTPNATRKPMSLPRLRELHARGEKITMLTAYDATFAAVADAAGVECILVGDSLGMVCQGLPSTTGVSLDTMCYHVASVSRGLHRMTASGQGTAWLIGDMPFGSYQLSPAQAFENATLLMQAGAHMVKLEGGGWTTDTVKFLVERGIPVCAHLGLTPQTVHALGGYRVQGRGDAGDQLIKEALALEAAGAQMLVLEMVPAELAARLTQLLSTCLTIGIGAGVDCDGQVLVLHDMLGINLGKMPRFVHNFMADAGNASHSVQGAFEAYVAAVKASQFPVNALHAW
jgi:3-methyl-2-oxobutanoate hydroxymethyltransferase